MKLMRPLVRIMLLVFSVCNLQNSHAQLSSANITEYFQGKDSTSELAVFYSSSGFRPLWLGGDEGLAVSFKMLLDSANRLALNPEDYSLRQIKDVLTTITRY